MSAPTRRQIAESIYNPHDLAAALVFMRKKFAAFYADPALADDILACVYLTGGGGTEYRHACIPIEWVICTGEVTRVARRQLAETIPVLGGITEGVDPAVLIQKVRETAAANRLIAVAQIIAEADAYDLPSILASLRAFARRPGLSADNAAVSLEALRAIKPVPRRSWWQRVAAWIFGRTSEKEEG